MVLLILMYFYIWDYKNAGTESIQKAISNFRWPKAFRNKNAKENCNILTIGISEVILYIKLGFM